MEIKKVMVIGAGQKGSGITQVCAQAGFEVLLNDLNEQALEKGLNNIDKLLTRTVDKERSTAKEETDTLNRIQPSSHLKDTHDCDVFIEEVVEYIIVKTNIFRERDAFTSNYANLVSNTSSFQITVMDAV